MSAATIAAMLRADRMFAHNDKGERIERARKCLCGRDYAQSLLSTDFMALVESRGQHAVDVFVRQIPDMYVPVFCPVCERHDIGNHAKRDAIHHHAGNPDYYDGDRDAAD